MKGISAPLIESVAFFMALSFIALLLHVSSGFLLGNEKIMNLQKTCTELNAVCFDGYSFLSREQLQEQGFTVIGSGNRIAIYLNKEGELVARLT